MFPPAERFTFLVSVHVFLFKANQVLLLQRANTGYLDGYFSVPAGHVDGGETISAAMRREAREEAGIELPADLQPAHAMHRMQPGQERVDYFFVTKKWQGDPTNCEEDKCSELAWYPLDKLPQPMAPYIKFALSQIKAGKQFSEFTENADGTV
jgi:8-oxo-dGTP diphosphatase